MAQLDQNVGDLIALARDRSRNSRDLLFRHIMTFLEQGDQLTEGEQVNLRAIAAQLLPHIDSSLRRDYFDHFAAEANRAVITAPPSPANINAPDSLLQQAADRLALARREADLQVREAERPAPPAPEAEPPVSAAPNTVWPAPTPLRALLQPEESPLPPRLAIDNLLSWTRDLLAQGFDISRAASDWSWETDADGLVTHLSDSATAVLNQPKILLIGHEFGELGRFPGMGRPDAWPRRRPFDEIPFETGIGGSAQRWLLRAVPVFDPATGKFNGFRGTAREDLTPPPAPAIPLRPAVRAEAPALALPPIPPARPMAGMPKAAASSERIYTLSHEFRTPLNAIMGFSELMAEAAMGPLDARYKNYAAGIGEAARRLLAIINDVLEKAQIEAGAIQLEPSLIRLDHLVESTVTEFIHSAPLRKCNLSLEFEGPTAVVFADGEFLRLMLSKLLSEAVHLTQEGSGIVVRTRMHDARTVEIGIDGLVLPSDITVAFWLMTNRLRDDELSPETMTGAFRLVLLRQTARLVNGDILLQGDATDAAKPAQMILRVPTFQGGGQTGAETETHPAV